MKIGFLTPFEPFPPNEGGRIVAYNHLRHLAERGHDIHLYATVGDNSSPPQELIELCVECEYVSRDRSLSVYFRGYDVPFPVASRHLPTLESALRQRSSKLDVIVAEHTFLAKYFEDISIPTCLCVHNLEYQSMLSSGVSLFPSPRSLAYFADAVRTYVFERDIYGTPQADSFAFLSQSELATVSRKYPSMADRTWHSPVGVDVDRFDAAPEPTEFNGSGPRIVFTGTMRYPPNVKAVSWFVEEVFPGIRANVPDAEFFIVGKAPVPEIRRLNKHSGVTVTGQVEDTTEYIANADVSVVPLREGTGIQIKLIEALAAGNQTVTTSVGIEGIDISDGEHVLVRNDAPGFAQAVTDILCRPNEFTELGQQARKLVRSTYAWEAVMDDFELHLRELQ
ncbi:glycosyltransferase [Haloprofundus salinisoli]|uniref:glycosyltransferase n=1 Tax=Haloprofundus salinisoli TaxID=2876193 RepID=UPI001CCDC848|nr:glycosyltransferase [Haloprofundus salinisoli]